MRTITIREAEIVAYGLVEMTSKDDEGDNLRFSHAVESICEDYGISAGEFHRIMRQWLPKDPVEFVTRILKKAIIREAKKTYPSDETEDSELTNFVETEKAYI